MSTKLNFAEHLEELEINKLLKYHQQNQLWNYYILVRLGISTAIKYSDLSQHSWLDVLGKPKLIIWGKKDKEVLFNPKLNKIQTSVYLKKGKPNPEQKIIPLMQRNINKQINFLQQMQV